MQMHVAAHNIGAAEARFGPDELRRLANDIGVPLLSANVRDSAGKLVAEPVRLVSAAGRRLALVGVLAERYATAELQVAPPRQAVIEALAQRRRKVRRGDRAGLSAGGRVAAVGRRPARGRRGRRRADRSAGRPEADRPDAVDLGHQQGQVPRPARCAGLWIGRSLEGEHRRTRASVTPTIRSRRAASIGFARAWAAATSRRARLRLSIRCRRICRRAIAVAGTAACKKCHEDDCRAVARIETRRGVEVAEGDRLARRSRVPALPHDRLRPAGRIRLASGRRFAAKSGRTSAARAVTAPRRPTSPTRPCIRRDSPGRRTAAPPATTAKTARSSTTTSIGRRFVTGRKRREERRDVKPDDAASRPASGKAGTVNDNRPADRAMLRAGRTAVHSS